MSTSNSSDLLLSFAINAAISAAIIGGFEVARHVHKSLFNRRWVRTAHEDIDRNPEEDSDGEHTTRDEAAAKDPRSWIPIYGWAPAAAKYNMQWLEKHRGMDAAMYICFLQEMAVLFSIMAVLNLAVIAPVNSLGSNKDLPVDDPRHTSGLLITSMANIPQNSSLLWLHAVMVMFVTGLAAVQAYRINRHYVVFKKRLRRSELVMNRAVLLRNVSWNNVPRSGTTPLWSDLEKRIRSRFGNLNLGEISHVQLIRKNDYLQALWRRERKLDRALTRELQNWAIRGLLDPNERERIVLDFNQTVSQPDPDFTLPLEHIAQENEPPAVPPSSSAAPQVTEVQEQIRMDDQAITAEPQFELPGFNCFGWNQTTDDDEDDTPFEFESLARVGADLNQTRSAILKAQQSMPAELTGVVFVIFKSSDSVEKCMQKKQRKALHPWKVSRAPRREAINWSWIYTNKLKEVAHRVFSLALYALMLFGWFFPVALIQTLGNLRQLALRLGSQALISFLDFVGPTVESFLNGFLPSILLVILMALVVPLLRLVAKREGRLELGKTDASVLLRFFFFLVFNVFLASSIAGSIFTQLQAIFVGDISLAALFANSLPSQGPFFIQYLLAKVCLVSICLLRPGDLLVYYIKSRASVARAERYLNRFRPVLDYAFYYGWDLLVVLISLTYSIMYPFILVFSAGYFLFATIVHRHNVIFVNCPKYEADGALWPVALQMYMIAIVLFQWTMFSILALQKSTSVIMPLFCFIGTILFMAWYFYHKKQRKNSSDPADLNFSSSAPLLPQTFGYQRSSQEITSLGYVAADRPDLDWLYYLEPIMWPINQHFHRP